jgi:hypothetical protein
LDCNEEKITNANLDTPVVYGRRKILKGPSFTVVLIWMKDPHAEEDLSIQRFGTIKLILMLLLMQEYSNYDTVYQI